MKHIITLSLCLFYNLLELKNPMLMNWNRPQTTSTEVNAITMN
jgi:hypothetical protein